jgi:hypothetical protein
MPLPAGQCREPLGLRGRTRNQTGEEIANRWLELLLRAFGGLVIDGAKWCGKTWTGRHFAPSAVYVQDRRTRPRADIDPDGLLGGAGVK